MHCGIADMTYKTQHARGFSVTLLLQYVINHHVHWQQPWVNILTSIKITIWPKHYEVKVTIPLQHKAPKSLPVKLCQLNNTLPFSTALEKDLELKSVCPCC